MPCWGNHRASLIPLAFDRVYSHHFERVIHLGRPNRVQYQGERLSVGAVDFEKSIVWIKWVGTHRDYDKIDVTEARHGGGGKADSDEA